MRSAVLLTLPLFLAISATSATSATSALADEPKSPAPAATSVGATVAVPAAPVADPELVRLRAAQGHSLQWNYVPAGQTARYGHAEVLVQAPVELVRTQVLDFAHYKDFSNGKFKTSRIVDKNQGTPGSTDLYVQVPIFHGMIMLWQIIRFDPLKTTAPGTELLWGKLVRGNVNAADIKLTMRVVDPQTTIVKCDLLIMPEMAAPQSSIDEELRDAAQNAVDAIQERAQRKVAEALVAAAGAGSAQTPPPAAVASAKPAN
ncbi:hypothetical protein BH09MYX1_BH09MYX1_27190 [soil metagenome]